MTASNLRTNRPAPARLLPVFLAACALAFAGVLCSCILAPTAHASVTSVSIDGKTIYASSAKTKIKSVEGASFDKKTSTLTLSNVKIVPKSKKSRSQGAVYIAAGKGDVVNIKLKGTNSITAGLADCCGIRTKGSLNISGTGLSMTGMGTAIQARGVLFGAGTFSFKRCTEAGVVATGMLAISGEDGGTLSVTTKSPAQSDAFALSSGTASNSHKRLGTVTGKLAKGMRFQQSGSVYQVVDADHVKLVSWGGGTQAKLSSVTFGKVTYQVSAIAAKAFGTAQGKKVTKIVLGPDLRSIGSEAFAGTERLTNIKIGSWLSGILSSVELTQDAIAKRFGLKDMNIHKQAFKGCGQLAGFDLAVHTGIKQQKVNLATKAVLTLYGLPLLAQVTK